MKVTFLWILLFIHTIRLPSCKIDCYENYETKQKRRDKDMPHGKISENFPRKISINRRFDQSLFNKSILTLTFCVILIQLIYNSLLEIFSSSFSFLSSFYLSFFLSRSSIALEFLYSSYSIQIEKSYVNCFPYNSMLHSFLPVSVICVPFSYIDPIFYYH